MNAQSNPLYGTPSAETTTRMKRIRSEDTKPEILVRRYLHGQGFRFRLHSVRLSGKPDIVLPKYKTVIFVQGCFWHRHGSGCGIKARVPMSNLSFWVPKLERTVQRDARVQEELRVAGWQVLVVWECTLQKAERGATLSRLTTCLTATLAPELTYFNYHFD